LADDVIRHRGLDGDVDQMMKVDHLNGGAHADLPSEAGRLAHQQFRHGQGIDLADVDGLTVMLADESDLEPELVGKDNLAKILVERLLRAGVRAKSV
jgi:hypothetical protein